MTEVYRTALQEKAIHYLNQEEKKKSTKRRDLIMDNDIFTGEFVVYDVS